MKLFINYYRDLNTSSKSKENVIDCSLMGCEIVSGNVGCIQLHHFVKVKKSEIITVVIRIDARKASCHTTKAILVDSVVLVKTKKESNTNMHRFESLFKGFE